MYFDIGEGEVVTFMKVKRADGSERYYKVEGESHLEIDQATYLAETGEG
jgi:hypothetical protein